MSTIDITTEAFEKTVLDNDIVLVDFWASLVRPVPPVRADLREPLEAKPATSCSARSTPRPSRRWPAPRSITSIPTLMAFRDGILVFSQPGALPPRRSSR